MIKYPLVRYKVSVSIDYDEEEELNNEERNLIVKRVGFLPRVKLLDLSI